MTALLPDLDSERISALLRSASDDDKTVLQAIHPAQIDHRLEIARRFFGSISGAGGGGAGLDIEGKAVLEVGCGQGDMTVVLAELVGEKGRVVAIDPAPLTYGSPLTLGEAQAVLQKTAVGSRMTFLQADVPSFFSQQAPEQPSSPTRPQSFDTAILAHCLLYFSSAAELSQTLTELRRSARVQHLCLAEWDLAASRSEAVPHLLALVAQAFLPQAEANVRTLFSREQVRRIAEGAGWRLRCESTIVSPPRMQDGRWEVDLALGLEAARLRSVHSAARVESERERDVTTFSTMCDSIRAHLPTPGSSKGVACVDVWTAVFDAV
ncbi:hypothetical protein OC835_002568 [Tilletia horrida]|nr:hypothetical protein OC835_002568 [Tilletia horrida]KAK0560817.1 hypothetical protein OC844_003545 [Tilletia horrida]